jgi:hypothetical protein
MAPTRRQKKEQLENSWVDGDNSDESGTEALTRMQPRVTLIKTVTGGSGNSLNEDGQDTDPDFEVESSQELSPTTPSSSPATKTLNSAGRMSQSSQNTLRDIGLRKNTQSNSRRVSGPELVFPSIHEVALGASWVANSQQRTPQSEQRRRRVHTPRQSPHQKTTAVHSSRPTSSVADMTRAFLSRMLEWSYDVVTGAFRALKIPISLFLAFYLFIGLITIFRNAVTSSLSTAISPICRVPGISYLRIPICQTPSPGQSGIPTPTHPIDAEFSDLLKLSTKFEDVLGQSASSVSLPLDMKRSEASIRDLRQVVRFSYLRSKNELGLEFDSFVDTARIASFDLQRFNSHVGRAVDSLLASARWTSRILDDAANNQESRGLIPTFVTSRILAPFQPYTLSLTESTLLDQYISYTGTVSTEIHRLIAEAQALLLVLQSLEDRLETIHGIAVRDSITTQASKNEILGSLWAALGGHRKDLRKYDTELALLNQVSKYRELAFHHVARTILKLQEMGSELEELKERVGSAELVGEKLPLSVHLEEVRLGIERLEKARFEGRRVEGEQLRKALGSDGVAENPLGWKGSGKGIGRR